MPQDWYCNICGTVVKAVGDNTMHWHCPKCDTAVNAHKLMGEEES